MSVIQVNNIHKRFGDKEILKGVDLSVKKGEVLTIIGPSGSGKTTFLRCLNFLEEADSGQLRIGSDTVDFEEVTKQEKLNMRRKTAMVFQQYNLFANKTALENITEGLIIPRKMDKKEAESIAKRELKKVGLKGYEGYYPNQLSGGQQQRVGIARALALRPDVILFDEPTSALDPELVNDTLEILADVANEGATMIVVTHEIGFAKRVADHVAFFDEGVIKEYGPAQEVIDNPNEERTRQFLSRIK